MRPLLFEKYEGLGNDFVVVEGTPAILSLDAVRAICDRHRGVGADGVLFTGINAGRPFMHVINADGSHAEMCGNGVRCVALHLVRRGLVEERAFELDTDSGPHAVRVLEMQEGRVEVAMRPASLEPRDVPTTLDRPMIDHVLTPLDPPSPGGGAPLSTPPEVRVTAVSMGNPHAVIFDPTGTARFALGPLVQSHQAFPAQVNVGFARITGDRAIELHVYERGAGWTQACGTGACAAAVAAVETKRAPRGQPIAVTLPGGTLEIVVGAPGEPIRMTGPARHVYAGKIEL